MLIAAFSGGKDSTAMVLRMVELGEKPTLLFTPTGNELPGLLEHVAQITKRVKLKRVEPSNRSLEDWINEYAALPNWRQRWCTRLIKIEPAKTFLLANPGATLCVGLRADEEQREGLYGDYATYRYPLREWGWGIKEVWDYLDEKKVCVPERTDCAVCPFQRLGEWYRLWRDHPEEFARGEAWEEQTGYTFRSPQRDTWPAALKELRVEFEKGRVPRGGEKPDVKACRVCRL